jgi:hypothetical protein
VSGDKDKDFELKAGSPSDLTFVLTTSWVVLMAGNATAGTVESESELDAFYPLPPIDQERSVVMV